MHRIVNPPSRTNYMVRHDVRGRSIPCGRGRTLASSRSLVGLFAFGFMLIVGPESAANQVKEILASSQPDLIDAEFSQERGQIVWVDRDAKLWVA